jgi:hypothetical protein
MIENKRKHLEFIQGVINRLSTNSFLLKGWSVALVAGLFMLSAKDAHPMYLYLTYIPAFMFWGLDGYCLMQERMYRSLYKHVRTRPDKDVDFCMDTKKVSPESASKWAKAIFSKTLVIFHGALVFAILVVMSVGF